MKPHKFSHAEKKTLKQLERSARGDLIAEAQRWGREDGGNPKKGLLDNPYIDKMPWNRRRRAWNKAFITQRAKLAAD